MCEHGYCAAQGIFCSEWSDRLTCRLILIIIYLGCIVWCGAKYRLVVLSGRQPEISMVLFLSCSLKIEKVFNYDTSNQSTVL